MSYLRRARELRGSPAAAIASRKPDLARAPLLHTRGSVQPRGRSRPHSRPQPTGHGDSFVLPMQPQTLDTVFLPDHLLGGLTAKETLGSRHAWRCRFDCHLAPLIRDTYYISRMLCGQEPRLCAACVQSEKDWIPASATMIGFQRL